MPSRIVEFYRLKQRDSEGRMLKDIWQWDDGEIEQVHDFIQWMFPLEEPSGVNPDAPLLTPEDKAAFRQDALLRNSLGKSLKRFLNFLGLEMLPTGVVQPAADFVSRLALWKYANHNWLRITRMLKSLRLLGFDTEAAAIWKCLRELHEQQGYVSENSFAYWAEAASGLD